MAHPENDRQRIGIPLCLDDRELWRRGRNYQYIDRAYADSVSNAGASVIYLPVQPQAERLVAMIDGLLIPGGDDFAPGTADPVYPADVSFDPAPAAQLDFDRALLLAARERQIPVLGICYGMQLIALADGGELHFHLPTDCPSASAHRLAEPGGQHPIAIEAGSRLAAMTGGTDAEVNSLHHQAVREAGAELRVVARSPDGVIEAIESPSGAPFCLGVQWHPERQPGAAGRGLIAAFVEAARSVRRTDQEA